MSGRFKVYALDFWGHGYSSRRSMDYGYPLFSRQVLSFMDALNIDKVSLVGHSMGGGTAIFIAANNPERVNKLVLVDATALPQPEPFAARLFRLPGLAEFLFALSTDRVRRAIITRNFFFNRDLVADDYFDKASRHQKIQGSTGALLDMLRKNCFHGLEDDLRRLARTEIPVLVVFGKEDKVVSGENLRKLHAICEGSRLEVLEGAGHGPNYERSDDFNRMAIDFLVG